VFSPDKNLSIGSRTKTVSTDIFFDSKNFWASSLKRCKNLLGFLSADALIDVEAFLGIKR
jgi:hypothetical protein